MKREDVAGGLIADPRMSGAIVALQAMISTQYPSANFQLSRGPDDPDQVLLRTMVDLDDPDEVLDYVSEYLLELQVDEGIPLHVIPLHTPERVLADMRARDAADRNRPARVAPVT